VPILFVSVSAENVSGEICIPKKLEKYLSKTTHLNVFDC
jgi:hypothetical protein